MTQSPAERLREPVPAAFIAATIGASVLFALTAYILMVWIPLAMMGTPCAGANSCDWSLSRFGEIVMLVGAPVLLLVSLVASVWQFLRTRERWRVELVWVLGGVGLFTLFGASYYARAVALGYLG